MSNGINVNPLNDITKVYLDQIANAKAKETQKDIERWTQKEEVVKEGKKKKRWQDDDGDGKWYEKSDVDGKISKREKEEKKKAVKEDIADIIAQLEKKRISKGGNPDESPLGKKTGRAMKSQQDKQRKKAGLKTEHHSKDCDDNCEPNCEHDEALKEGYGKKKAKKVKKESFSDWRTDLREIMTDEDEEQKEIKEKNVKNKIKINPKLGEAIEEIGGEVLEAYTVTKADKKGNTPAWQGYKSGKKNVKTGKPLYKAADHLKNEEVEEFEESEKVAQGAQKRAEVLASRRRQKGYREKGYNAYRPGKNERAGYNLSRAARSSDASAETQRTKKKKPAGEDTSQIGHYKKRDEKQTVGKRGKPLKQPKYKLSMGQRVDHHSNKALSRRDPKQNPKHTANK